jgi:hypothetical protein
MSIFKGQLLHLGALGVASVLAFTVWTRDDNAQLTPKSTEVEVWSGSPDSLSALSFDSEKRKLRLEPKKDALGRYYVGTVDKDDPTFVHPPGGADGGAAPNPTKRTTIRFVSIKSAEELVTKLAPLRALRAVGKVEGTRAEEFGLDKPEGTLKLTVGGKPQSLIIGGATPGGSERYAKTGAGDVFAIPGDLVQTLLFADVRLTERDLQPFQADEPTRVVVAKSGKQRELSRMADKKDGWADTATPTKLDETAGNWMAKLGRLRVQDWVEKPSAPVTPETTIVHVDYFAGAKKLGSVELYKLPGEKANEYLAKSEYSRWYARVVTSTAEQVDQDSASLVK